MRWGEATNHLEPWSSHVPWNLKSVSLDHVRVHIGRNLNSRNAPATAKTTLMVWFNGTEIKAKLFFPPKRPGNKVATILKIKKDAREIGILYFCEWLMGMFCLLL